MYNNVASSRNLVLGLADLKIRKFGKPDWQVAAGETLSYTIIVDNLGPSIAEAVRVRDFLVSNGEYMIAGLPDSVRPQVVNSA